MKLKLAAGEDFVDKLVFNKEGLIPAVVQEYRSRVVLMLAYMNREALLKTLDSGYTWFWSRSRASLWQKGETSGHCQKVKEIVYDCDADALLVTVEQEGMACHTGEYSCFHNRAAVYEQKEDEDRAESDMLKELVGIIRARRQRKPSGSYVAGLFAEGLDKMLKKIGEEAAEVIIAAKNECREELIHETADLLFHMMVVLEERDVSWDAVLAELRRRHKRRAEID